MKAKITILALLSLLLGLNVASAKGTDGIKNKMGGNYLTIAGAEYTLDSKTTTDTGSDSTNVTGFMLFYERLLTSRFGLGASYSVQAERSGEMTVGTDKNETLETSSLYTVDLKAYFKDHKRAGLKPYAGVSFGSITAKTTITTTASGASTSTEGETKATVPLTILSFGFDYLYEFAGFRVDWSLTTGKREDRESHSSYNATYNYAGSAIGLTVYSFF